MTSRCARALHSTGQVEALGVRAAPGGDQQVRAFDPLSTQPRSKIRLSCPVIDASSPARYSSTRCCIRFIVAAKSVSTVPAWIPKSSARRARCATRALLRRVLVGVQP